MRTPFALIVLLCFCASVNAEQVTSTTSVTNENLMVDDIGVTSISFSGTNAFDFSGDGIDDQELHYTLTIETSDSKPLIPLYDIAGNQTGDLDLDSNLSPILVTYSVDDMVELPQADPNFNYSFVNAEFLHLDISVNRGSSLIIADASKQTEIQDTTISNFNMESQGHLAAQTIGLNEVYVFKASPEIGTNVLQGLTHSTFTVDVTAVPEPVGFVGLLAIGLLVATRRLRD